MASTGTATSPAAAGSQAARNRTLFYVMAPIALMTFVLGGVIALALKTENRVRLQDLPSPRFSGLAEYYMSTKKYMLADQDTIKYLQMTNARLNQTVTARSPGLKVLADQINDAQLIGGQKAVEGTGIVVTLADSKHAPQVSTNTSDVATLVHDYNIHDLDIELVVNELKAAGGEAFSVNGERIIATTPISCVGPSIQVNGIPMTSPFQILAIGDPSELTTALTMNGGIVDGFKMSDPAMISIKKQRSIVIPAYAGAIQYHFAKPVLAGSAKSAAR